MGVTPTLPYADFMTRFARAVVLTRLLADKDRMEALIFASDVDYTVVRPVGLTSGRASGYRVADDQSIRGGFVSRADVAAFCVDELEKHAWSRKAPSIVKA